MNSRENPNFICNRLGFLQFLNRPTKRGLIILVMKMRKLLFGFGGVVLASALLINPRLTNPPVEAGHDLLATNAPPAELVKVLRSSCYDCHSDETKWPWYSHVAPVSWWVVEHVESGRKRMNFSKWPHNDPRKVARRWRNMGESVLDGDMPYPSYAKGHPEARLTEEQRKTFAKLCDEQADRIRRSITTEENE